MKMLKLRKIFQTEKIGPQIEALLVFCVVALFYAAAYYANPGILFMDDHFFHFKYSLLLRTEGFDAIKNFNWIYLTQIAQEHSSYRVSLFQIFNIPFTYITDQLFALKISDIFWGSSSIAVLYYIFKKFNIKYPILFLSILMASGFFASRIISGRPFVLATVLALLLLYFGVEKKHKQIFFLSIFYIFWHQTTFFMPIVVVCMCEAARVLVGEKIYSKNFFFAIAGSMISSLLYFQNIFLTLKNIFATQMSTLAVKGEGVELYTQDIYQILNRSEGYMFLFVVGTSFVIYLYIEIKKGNLVNEKTNGRLVAIFAAFLFALMAFAGTILISGRFMDYYFPVVVLLTGLIISFFIEEEIISGKNSIAWLSGISVFLFILLTNNFLNIRSSISNHDVNLVKDAAVWISQKSDKGDKVYLYDWGYFPASFFYNTKNVYSMGIEPRALHDYNSSLYWKWYNIVYNGIYCEKESDCLEEKAKFSVKFKQASIEERKRINTENQRKIIQSIKNDFGAKFIMIDAKQSVLFDDNEDLIRDRFVPENESGLYAFELK